MDASSPSERRARSIGPPADGEAPGAGGGAAGHADGRGHRTAGEGGGRLLALLGLPTLGLALSVTVVASFVPLLLERLSGPLVAGAFIAAEGLFALTVFPARSAPGRTGWERACRS